MSLTLSFLGSPRHSHRVLFFTVHAKFKWSTHWSVFSLNCELPQLIHACVISPLFRAWHMVKCSRNLCKWMNNQQHWEVWAKCLCVGQTGKLQEFRRRSHHCGPRSEEKPYVRDKLALISTALKLIEPVSLLRTTESGFLQHLSF